MFYTLLIVTLVLSTIVSSIIAAVFSTPVHKILRRVIQDEVYSSWARYLTFAIYVVGISSGVRINQLEQYITPAVFRRPQEPLALTTERWTIEVYRTLIGTLQGLAWTLLVFFVVALIAFVVVRIVEAARPAAQARTQNP